LKGFTTWMDETCPDLATAEAYREFAASRGVTPLI